MTPPEPTEQAGTRPKFLVGGPGGVRIVQGPNDEITVHAASVIVSDADDAHPQITADRVTQTPGNTVLEGDVRFVFDDGASLTATRVVAKQAADGSMTFAAENAVVATRRAK